MGPKTKPNQNKNIGGSAKCKKFLPNNEKKTNRPKKESRYKFYCKFSANFNRFMENVDFISKLDTINYQNVFQK